MSSIELAAFAFAVVLLWVLARWIRRIRIHTDRSWLPPDLQDAALVYVERLFKATQPIPLVARLDRGYRRLNGVIVLVELKTRRVNRAFFSDVIELSAQRVAIEGQTAERVDDYGYVLIQQPGRQRRAALRVKLLMTEDVIALAKRREVILGCPDVAEYARIPGLCRDCAFLSTCKPPYDH